MEKKSLSKVVQKDFTREDLNLNEIHKNKKFILKAEVVDIEKENILVLYCFSISKLKKSETVKPDYRMFQSNDDYITQDLRCNNVKWLTSCLENLLRINFWSYIHECYVDKKSSRVIKNYLNTKDDPIQEIRRIQSVIMRQRLKRKHEKITDRIDKQMELITELPQNFNEWLEKVAFFKSKYIFYQYKANRKKQQGYCTHCKKEVLVENQRHNRIGICPSCGSQIKYKALGKSKSVVDDGYASIVQKTERGIVLRDFSIEKNYKDDYRNSKISFYEERRTFFEGENILRYEYAEFKQTCKWRWCDFEGKVNVDIGALYSENLELLKDTDWRYSAVELMSICEPGYKFNAYKYLTGYKEHPILEYLVKLKLYNLANDLISGYRDINEKGRKFEEIFEVNKSYLPLFQKLNINTRGLRIIQRLVEENIKLTEEKIICLCNDNICKNYQVIFDLTKYSKVNYTIKYLQSQIGKGIEDEYIVTDWRDYLEACKKLKFDLTNDFILYPRNLEQEHDKVDALIEYERNKRVDKAMKSMYKELVNLYQWENKKYAIIVPKESMEIIKEGQKLRHCVGGYIERVAKRQTTILFLREKKNIEKNFYTIEVVDDQIIQCRGYKNQSYSSEISKVLKGFREDKLSKLKKVG